MPKLIIAGNKPEVPAPPVELSLQPHGDRIRVYAKRGQGNRWALLDIEEDGSIYLHTAVGADLGFDLDDGFKVKIAT